MRVRLKGINRATKRLADGTKRTYWYAWRGGPLLQGEPGTPEFVASYNEAVARKAAKPRGTLLSLLQQYQASEDFTGLAPSTRRGYIALIRRIEGAFAPESFRGAWIAALLPRTHASVGAGSTAALGGTMCGRLTTSPHSWPALPHIYTCRCCWRYGQASVKVTCCDFPGQLMTGLESD